MPLQVEGHLPLGCVCVMWISFVERPLLRSLVHDFEGLYCDTSISEVAKKDIYSWVCYDNGQKYFSNVSCFLPS